MNTNIDINSMNDDELIKHLRSLIIAGNTVNTCNYIMKAMSDRFYLDCDKVRSLYKDDRFINSMLYNIIAVYLSYNDNKLSSYFLLYCSNVEKIKEVLDNEFKKSHERFFVGLYDNYMSVTLR